MHNITTSPVARTAAIAALVLTLAMAGCATGGLTRAPARVDVQPQVGFTINDAQRLSGGLRTDHQEALVLLEQGQLERGIALLEAVLEAAPHASAARVDLAVAQHRAGNLEKAEQHLLAALQTNPAHPVAQNELGIIYRKTGRLAEARRSYEAALDTYGGYHVARRNLAVLCELYLADLACARDNYEAYLETVHSDEDVSMWLASVKLRLGEAAQ